MPYGVVKTHPTHQTLSMRQLKITHQITNRDTLSLDKYLSEIGKVDLITAEEEVELAKKIQQGDQKALNRLTKANLRFVVSVAKQYQNQGLPLTDLINEGNIGLVKAAQRFDSTKGFKFISYAVWWIRQSIMQAIVDHARLVRLPLNKVGAYNKLSKAAVKFEQEHSRQPTPDELADLTDFKASLITELINSSGRPVSMDAPFTDDDDGNTIGNLMWDEDQENPDGRLLVESIRKEVQSMLEKLPDREASIVECYFGLNGNNRHTLEEIGEKFDLTRERVRQIKERALRRLRRIAQHI